MRNWFGDKDGTTLVAHLQGAGIFFKLGWAKECHPIRVKTIIDELNGIAFSG